MKTDLYTKIVLTVIAVCLTVNLLKEFEVIPTAKANTAATAQAPQPIATQAAPVDVNISHIGNIPITNYHPSGRLERAYYDEINLYNGIPATIRYNNDK